MEMKTCSLCKKQLPTSSFRKQETGRDGLRANCLICDKQRCKEYYNKRTEEQKEKAYKRSKDYYEKNKDDQRAKARDRYHKKYDGVVKKKPRLNFSTAEEYRLHKNKKHNEYMKSIPGYTKKMNKQMRERHGETINAKMSLSRTFGIPYKEVKNYPELVELKKLQLNGMKESALLLKTSDINSKICLTCGEEKNKVEFYKRSNGSETPNCKVCYLKNQKLKRKYGS